MNRQKQTEYNRLFWRGIKIAFVVSLDLTFMPVNSILEVFGL